MARRLTFGRVLVLLLLGVGIAVGILVSRYLSPKELERQVTQVLEELIAADFRFEDVSVDLNGIEVTGLEIYYPDKTLALAARRVHVAVSQKRLWRGEVVVKQITASGVRVHLRLNRHSVPDLPGILRKKKPGKKRPRELFPILVNNRAGQNWITLHGWPSPAQALPLEIECKELFLRPSVDRYELTATFAGERVESIILDGTYHAAERTVRISAAKVKGLSWDREHMLRLATLIGQEKDRPPVELGGVADLTLEREFVFRQPRDLLDIDASATLRRLNGNFGNMFPLPGEDGGYDKTHGLPFRVRDGRCSVRFENRKLAISDLATMFASSGDEGHIRASYTRDFGRSGNWEDFKIRGWDIFTRTELLALLMPHKVASNVIGPFRPGGTFAFDVSVSNRPGRPEKVNVDVRIKDGHFEYEGFRYPLDQCTARIRVETNVARPRGPCDVVRFSLARGPDVWKTPGATQLCVRGRGRIETYARSWESGEDPEFQEISIHIANLPFDEKLARAMELADPEDETYATFGLGGQAHRVDVEVISDDFGVQHSDERYRIELRNCTAAYRAFPLPLVRLSGTILRRTNPPLSKEDGLPEPELSFENLRAHARDGGIVTAHGKVRNGIVDVMVNAKGLVLGPDLKQTLKDVAPQVHDIWETLRPSGAVDVTVDFGPKEGTELAVTIDLGGTANFGGFDDFVYPIRGIEGSIFYFNEQIELQGVRCTVDDARLTLDGYTEEDGTFNVYGFFAGPVREELLAATAPVFGGRVFPEGFSFREGTQVRYKISSKRPTPDAEPILVTALNDVVLKTRVRGINLRMDGGRVHVNPSRLRVTDMRITKEDNGAGLDIVDAEWPFSARQLPRANIRAEGLDPDVDITPFLGDGIAEFLGSDIRLDIPLMSVAWRATDASLQLNGTIGLHRAPTGSRKPGEPDATGIGPTGILVIKNGWLQPEPPRGGAPRFRGALGFKDLNFTRVWAPGDMSGTLHVDDAVLAGDFILHGRVDNASGTIFEFFADALRLDIDVTSDTLSFSRIDGNFHGGRVTGEAFVHLGDPGGYKVRLDAKAVNLRKMLAPFLSHNDPLAGTMDFGFRILSLTGETRDQTGKLYVRVRDGQLYQVPGLRKIVSLLGRVAPFGDRGSRFTDAVAEADIAGEVCKVRRLHLSTATNDVHMTGRVTFFGDLDLDVRPQVTRLIDLPRIIDIPVLSALRNLWHDLAYEIRLEGTIGSPALRLHGLPWLKKRAAPFIQSPHAGRIRRMRPRVIP